MHIDGLLVLAGLVVGFTVGLTGMGGGALMTPILVLLFKVQPLAAVSSDLVAAVVMKPIGGGVHLRRGTVNKSMVGWLALGSVPAGFVGVLILHALGNGQALQDRIKLVLGIALLMAASSIALKAVLAARRRVQPSPITAREVELRPLPTVLIGIAGGLVVGMTSVGSGSLMIVLLLWLYPRLRASDLVGTDLVQAIPLVASAALGHLFFGEFKLDLTTSLLIGAIPGVYAGARLSVNAPDGIIRPALLFVLLASALKLLGMDTVLLGWTMGAIALIALVAVARRVHGRRGQPEITAAEPSATVPTR
ncbi:MAG: Membrane protein putative match [Acidimicrobiales bacterium]|nr:Membrane protein putative match [Acidimicrobiales bacterium]